MTCPTCGFQFPPIGCCLITGQPVRWCARCGTLAPCDRGNTTAPALVYSVRGYMAAVQHLDGHPDMTAMFGIYATPPEEEK